MLTAAVVDRTAVAVAIDTVTYYYGGRHRRTFTNKTNFVLRVEVILAKCRRRSMYQQNPTPALGELHNTVIKYVLALRFATARALRACEFILITLECETIWLGLVGS